METIRFELNRERKVVLQGLLQAVGGEYKPLRKRPGMLVLPGGGYKYCSDREADNVALAYASAGYQVFILRYTVARENTWPQPLEDYELAMQTILERAEEWNLDAERISVIGFSAGGHLAACAATVARHKPAAAILGYAVLSRESADMCQRGMPVPADLVNNDTCPCFLFAARDDGMVPVTDTLRFELALAEHGISFESHIYPMGGHGFTTGEAYLNGDTPCGRASAWVKDSLAWLEDMQGAFLKGDRGTPRCKPRLHRNGSATLSVDCTLGYLRKKDTGNLLRFIYTQLDNQQRRLLLDHTGVFNRMTLRDVLHMLGRDEECASLDAALRKIPDRTDAQ